MTIIGITGTLGAGKGTIVEYLAKEKGYQHFSVRQYLTEVMRSRGLEVNRDNMVVTANELRAKHSPSFIIEELYRQAEESGRDAVIESIRTPGEIDYLKGKGNFLLIAVDADPEIRYERIKSRGSSTDRVDYKKFLDDERREMNSTDPNSQNLQQCIARADIRLMNNGTIEQLIGSVEKQLP